MNTDSPLWSLVLGLIAVDLLLRAVVYAYYADADRVLRVLRLKPRIDGRREEYYKRYDVWLAPLPFLWTWIDIVAAALAAHIIDHPLAWVALVVWVGGRFRALQEFGHNAVHFALCRARGWQWWLSDFFYQFPAFKRDMHSRQVTHTLEHHRNPNHETLDPNRMRVKNGGMCHPLTPAAFHWRLCYPLTVQGALDNVRTMYRNSLLNRGASTVAWRFASLALAGSVLYASAGWQGVVFGWLLPLLTTYPLFAWVSLLTEHRWFVTGASEDRRQQEYIAGRPTDYPGVTGWLVRVFICPTSDAYHLAHSLYPGVRWNYLPAIDRVLKTEDPDYTRHASQGLLFSRDGIPSALSELKARLTVPAGQVLAMQPEGERP